LRREVDHAGQAGRPACAAAGGGEAVRRCDGTQAVLHPGGALCGPAGRLYPGPAGRLPLWRCRADGGDRAGGARSGREGYRLRTRAERGRGGRGGVSVSSYRERTSKGSLRAACLILGRVCRRRRDRHLKGMGFNDGGCDSVRASRVSWLLLAVLVGWGALSPGDDHGFGPAPAIAQTDLRQVPQSRQQITWSFAPLVQRAAPAVVNIYTRRVVRDRGPSLLFNDPFFRRFFGDLAPSMPGRERIQNALGSGVIVDPSGLIVTNAHVIEGSDEVTVVLPDRREFDATVVRSDPHSDLAVLRVDARGDALPTIPLGDSDQLQVGDLVLAIGNPFGVGQTVTSGIVSAVARTNPSINDYGFCIQTDAAINPGNSGGALIDMNGRLIGVNTAIYSRSGGSMGIGFAIPANLVRTVLASVGSGRPLVRPWLGAEVQAVTQDLATAMGLSRPRGVLISNLHPRSPFARAGGRVGDIVTAV